MLRKKLTAEETKRALEYREGDIVQIRADGDLYAGRIGVIIGIGIYISKKWRPELSYHIKFSDTEGIAVPCCRIRLIREAGSDEDLPESKSQFLPMRTFWFY